MWGGESGCVDDEREREREGDREREREWGEREQHSFRGVILTCNVTNLILFKFSFQYILARRAKMY